MSGRPEDLGVGTFTIAIETVSTSTSTCTNEDFEAVSGLDAWPGSVQTIAVDGSGYGSTSGGV